MASSSSAKAQAQAQADLPSLKSSGSFSSMAETIIKTVEQKNGVDPEEGQRLKNLDESLDKRRQTLKNSKNELDELQRRLAEVEERLKAAAASRGESK